MPADLTRFDYQKVAKLDAETWRSYYNGNHNFYRLFTQALGLIKNQFGFSWYASAKLAYYAGWAASSYRLKSRNENYPRTLKNLTKMFKTVSANCSKPFDFKKAAELELEWWDIQRYPGKHKKSLAQSLDENMTTVYGLNDGSVKGYGSNRAAALELLNKTGDDKQIRDYLVKAWRSLHLAIQK